MYDKQKSQRQKKRAYRRRSKSKQSKRNKDRSNDNAKKEEYNQSCEAGPKNVPCNKMPLKTHIEGSDEEASPPDTPHDVSCEKQGDTFNTESLTSSRSKSSSDKSDEDPVDQSHSRHTSGCSSDQYFIRSRTNSDLKGVELLEPDLSPLVALAYSSSSLSMMNDAQHKDPSLQSNGHASFERMYNPSEYLEEDDLQDEKLNICSVLGLVGQTLKKIFPFLDTKRTMVTPADSIPRQIQVTSSQQYRISAQRRRKQKHSRRAG